MEVIKDYVFSKRELTYIAPALENYIMRLNQAKNIPIGSDDDRFSLTAVAKRESENVKYIYDKVVAALRASEAEWDYFVAKDKVDQAVEKVKDAKTSS